MKKRRSMALALCAMLALPGAAAAVTEDVVQAAPDVDVGLVLSGEAQSLLPDADAYLPKQDETYAQSLMPAWAQSETAVQPQFEGDYPVDVCQAPQLTPGEIARAARLKELYDAGLATGDGASVLNATQDVRVGVYALNPEDFDGERVYHVLGGACLTDEQLLAIIDAYHRLGEPFDPEAICSRNCVRGGGLESSRAYTGEERARMEQLADLIGRGLIDAEVASPEPPVTVYTDKAYFMGLDRVTILPYRRLTDAELVAELAKRGVTKLSRDADDIEAQARSLLCELLGMPLSAKADAVVEGGGYIPLVRGEDGQAVNIDTDSETNEGQNPREAYSIAFTFTGETGRLTYAGVLFDAQTGEAVQLYLSEQNGAGATEEADPAVTPEAALGEAARYAESLGIVPQVGAAWALKGEASTNWGACYALTAQIDEDVWAEVFVGCDDGIAHGVEIDASGRFAQKAGAKE